jgi:hypothetical protein
VATSKYPVVDVVSPLNPFGTQVFPGKVDLVRLSKDLGEIRDSFLRVLNQQKTAGAYQLKKVDVSLTVTAEGTVGFVTASAAGSISLSFEP